MSLQRVEELFDRAYELSAAERERFLARECGDDDALKREVLSLLASAPGAGDALRCAVRAVADSLASAHTERYLGARFGPYRVRSVIGEGGMGTVYLAERDDEHFHKRVAIKILQHGLASPAVVARFRDERQILAALDHPSIVRLLDGGSTEDGLPYLVMEHVAGVPLAKHAAALPVRARVELVVRVCGALSYAHQQLVVHRDIKPSNILVAPDGVPKLLDFGIAKLLDPTAGTSREAKTRTGMALLTPEYASPEQARGEPVGVATDVYSLGAVLYELLVGAPPQRVGDSVLETLETICKVDPPRPSTVAPRALRKELAGDLDNIILKALHKQPARRYPSVAALADDLQRYLDGLPVRARDATVGYRLRKYVARNRGALALAAAIALALSTATVVSIVQARRAERERQRAETQTRALLAEQGFQELQAFHATRALPYLAEALRRGDDTPAMRFLLAEAERPFERELRTIRDLADGLSDAAWSPDGSRLALAGKGQVRLYDRTGALVRTLAVDPVHWVGAPAFRGDGARLALAVEGHRLVVYDVASGTRVVDDTGRSGITMLRYARRGDRLVAVREDNTIEVWDGGRARVIAGAADPGIDGALAPDGARAYVAHASGAIDVVDCATGAVVATWRGHPEGAKLAISHDGARLYSIDRGIVRIWTVATGESIVMPAHHGEIPIVDVSPDDRWLVSGGADGIAKLWDARTGAPVAALIGHANGVKRARFSPDSTRVLTTGGDNTFRLWDVASGAQEAVLEAVNEAGSAPHANSGTMGAEWSPDGSQLFTGAGGALVLWKPGREPLQRELAITGPSAYAATLSPDGTRAAIGGPHAAELWDVAGPPRRLHVLAVPPVSVWETMWSPDDRHVLVVGEHGLARMFDAHTGALAYELRGHGDATVNRASFSPDARLAITSSDDHLARLWDVATGQLLRTLAHPDRAMSAAWTRDGRVVTACWDKRVRVWDVATGRLLRTIALTTEPLDVAVAPDQHRFATADHDGQVELWDLDTGERALSFEGHTGAVTTVAWSPDGALLASSGYDRTSRIWDPATGKQLGVRMHRRGVMQIVWTPDSRSVLAAAEDGTVRLWDVHRDERAPAAIAAYARDHAPYRLVGGRLEFVRLR